jgi:integrase
MGRYQDGHLVKRFGGWHVRYYVTEQGIRKQKSHRLCSADETKSHAKELRDKFLAEQVNIGVSNEGPMGVVEFWDKIYWDFIKDGNLKPSTLHGYRQIWNQHLKAHFGAMNLSDYKTATMTNFLTGLAKKLRPRTLDRIKWLASAIFAHAVATGKCESNPIRDAKVLGKTLPNGVTGFYSLEEIENVITALVDHPAAQLVMALSFFAGLRKGEIQGLQWPDIDENYIHVRRAFSRGVVSTPKSKDSVRSLPIIGPVKLLLKLWRQKAGEKVWLFTNSEGTAQNMDQLAREVIIPCLKKAEIPWRGYHAGRRGLGDALKQLTGSSDAGRDVLGQATSDVTRDHYEDKQRSRIAALKLLGSSLSK